MNSILSRICKESQSTTTKIEITNKQHEKNFILKNEKPSVFTHCFIIVPDVRLNNSLNLFAQDKQAMVPDSIKVPVIRSNYPKTVGYLSFIVPLVTFNKNYATPNFNGTTSIGFPVGINVLYSDRFGFSYEFTPTIKATNTNSKVSNVLFDPGTMFRFDHGFTIITRLAFETSGRYGFTPVFNQVYARTKYVNYFVAASLPARFGNAEIPTLGINLQFGFTFN